MKETQRKSYQNKLNKSVKNKIGLLSRLSVYRSDGRDQNLVKNKRCQEMYNEIMTNAKKWQRLTSVCEKPSSIAIRLGVRFKNVLLCFDRIVCYYNQLPSK